MSVVQQGGFLSTCSDIDAFMAARPKTLPAEPDWRIITSRAGERRCYLPITVDGVISNLTLEMTVNLRDDSYLVINLLAPSCISRLCLATEHFDRARGELVEAPHWHSWRDNRPKGKRLPKELLHAEGLAGKIVGREDAFAWFLKQIGVDFPPWSLTWPPKDVML